MVEVVKRYLDQRTGKIFDTYAEAKASEDREADRQQRNALKPVKGKW